MFQQFLSHLPSQTRKQRPESLVDRSEVTWPVSHVTDEMVVIIHIVQMRKMAQRGGWPRVTEQMAHLAWNQGCRLHACGHDPCLRPVWKAHHLLLHKPAHPGKQVLLPERKGGIRFCNGGGGIWRLPPAPPPRNWLGQNGRFKHPGEEKAPREGPSLT